MEIASSFFIFKLQDIYNGILKAQFGHHFLFALLF
jgi:hypothetical protein